MTALDRFVSPTACSTQLESAKKYTYVRCCLLCEKIIRSCGKTTRCSGCCSSARTSAYIRMNAYISAKIHITESTELHRMYHHVARGCTHTLLQDVHTRCYWMYSHVATGCTKIGNVQTGNVQPHCYRIYKNWKCINLEMYKLEMYKIWKCTTTCYWMYKKKSLSKPINMGSSFENLDTRSSKVKTVRNLDQRFSRYFILKFRFCKKREKLASHLPYPFLSHPPHV